LLENETKALSAFVDGALEKSDGQPVSAMETLPDQQVDISVCSRTIQ